MSCPDINRLIDFLVEDRPDSELEAHLEQCVSCQADFRLLREIPVALRPEIEVPERLVRRVMAGIPLPENHLEKRQIPASQVLGSGLLGTLTTISALVAIGSGGTGDPADMLLFSLAVGSVASLVQIRFGWPELSEP